MHCATRAVKAICTQQTSKGSSILVSIYASRRPVKRRGCLATELCGDSKDSVNPLVASSFKACVLTMFRSPGCSEADLDEIERWSGMELPQALRIMYRFCNGQDERRLQAPRLTEYRHWNHWGLFGG